jgi:hypothetical protein
MYVCVYQLMIAGGYEYAGEGVRHTENPIYVFSEKELCGLSPNSYIYASASDLYIPRIGPHIWLQQNRQTDSGNIFISHRYVSVGIGRQNIIILFLK